MGFSNSKLMVQRDKQEEGMQFLTGNKGEKTLEDIANHYMKQDSYRRSQWKYGVDIAADEIAEDVPSTITVF